MAVDIQLLLQLSLYVKICRITVCSPSIQNMILELLFNACTVRLLLSLFQPSNAQIYITAVSLYIMCTAACFDAAVTGYYNVEQISLYHQTTNI